jgi:hypothetical protein
MVQQYGWKLPFPWIMPSLHSGCMVPARWSEIPYNYDSYGSIAKHVSQFGDVNWPPWSPEFTTLDLLLWGMLKSHVHHTCPATMQDLKVRIWDEFLFPKRCCRKQWSSLQEVTLRTLFLRNRKNRSSYKNLPWLICNLFLIYFTSY